MSSAATSNGGTVWSILLLLAVVPAAYLYGQYNAKDQGSPTAGSSKTAAKKRKKAAAKSKAMAGEVPVSTGTAAPTRLSSEPVQDASFPATVAETASSSKKSKRKKNKAATTTTGNEAPAGSADVHAIPGSFETSTHQTSSPPATTLVPAASTGVDEWQTTRSDRKTKNRSQKAGATPATPATAAAAQALAPASKFSASSVTPSAVAPESVGSVPSVQAAAWSQEEPIDWGNTHADDDWSAGAAWDAPAPIAPSAATESEDEDEDEDEDSDYEVVAYPTPLQAARPTTTKSKPRKLRGKSAAELHPSEFFASTPAVAPVVAQPKAPVWENVPTRSTRSPSKNPSRSQAPAGAAVSSRFSSQNAFSMLKEEGGDVSLDNNGNASRVVQVAPSAPTSKVGTTKTKSAPRLPTSEPTKKQRQNAAKREATRLAREEAERERVAALAAHRRARTTPRAPAPAAKSGFASVAKGGGPLDQATLLQLAQGSRKQPSGGQRAQVDERGNLVWQ